MENKKDLAKIALAALILASATPVNGQADIEAHGIVLAAGCASHGCPAVKNGSASTSASDNNAYHARVPNQSSSDSSNQPNSNATLTEAQLLSMLNPQGRAIYLSLDQEAKALAIQLASQDSYRDKNLAIKEAQRRMNERRDTFNR